jgi:hypothetical protein
MSIPITDEYGVKMPSVDYITKNFSTNEIKASLTKHQRWLFVAALASFLASAMSVVKYMAGGTLDPMLWTGEQTISAMIGLFIVAIVVAGEVFAFSSGFRGIVMALFTAMFVFFGVFTEVTQAMERENEGVMIRSQQSPTYQAALQSINNLTAQAEQPVSNPFASQIAEQAQVVARCEHRVLEGKEPHCNGDKARLSALKNEAAATMNATSQSKSSAIVATLEKAKEWERDENQHYGMIKLLKSWFGIDVTTATFIFSLIIIITFRAAFFWIGDQVAVHKQALEKLGSRRKPETQNASAPVDPSSVPETQDLRTDTQKPGLKKREVNYERVPAKKIVQLASVQLLCKIADGELESFSVRAVNQALKELGYGRTNAERQTEIYPLLVDHFEKEEYIRINQDWVEDGDNGKRQKWLLNVDYCKEKAAGIPRD